MTFPASRSSSWVLASAVVVSACGPVADTASPVATPTVDVARTEAPAGSPVDLTYRFRVADEAPAFTEDYWVFVHFLDSDGELMWTDDHQPPTPTRQWEAGALVEYSRTLFLPKPPYTGAVRIVLGLYLPQSGERLPLSGRPVGLRSYEVAAFTLRSHTENALVVFGRGWHAAERAPDGSGVEWRWTEGEAALSFRNPGRETILFLDVAQPMLEAVADRQRVEVRIGDTIVDSFALLGGQRELRRVGLGVGQLGSADTVEVTLSVATTFVPASMPELRAGDPRTLGVQVFNAFVQPK